MGAANRDVLMPGFFFFVGCLEIDSAENLIFKS